MGAQKSTTWEIEPHTRAKHEILRRYLEAWTAILGRSGFPRIAYVQGKTARRDFLHGLYLKQLRAAARAKYVRSFEMRNDKDVTDYYLFFATNSRKGIIKMKEAMWKVDQSGEFRFSDATNPDQALLFSPKPDFAALRTAILAAFSGREATVAEVER